MQLALRRPPSSLLPFLYRHGTSLQADCGSLHEGLVRHRCRHLGHSARPRSGRSCCFPLKKDAAVRQHNPPHLYFKGFHASANSLQHEGHRSSTTPNKASNLDSHRAQHSDISKVSTSRHYAEDVPFEQVPKFDESPGSKEKNTMTGAEKAVFARLFGSIPENQNISVDRKRRIQIDAAVLAGGKAKKSLVEEAEDDLREQYIDASQSNMDLMPSRDFISEASARLQKYPLGLREMAATAELQLADVTKQDENPLLKEARKEMKRIEALLLKAKSDSAVWSVLENEVFSKFKLLGLDDKINESKAKRKKRLENERIRAQQQADGESNAARPAEKEKKPERKKHSHVALLAHAYSPLLLAATRILIFAHRQQPPSIAAADLDTATSTDSSTTATTPPTARPTHVFPSPLPLQILARARSLGATSYALAASTPLYNELVRYAWRTTGAYARPLALLAEMDAAGLTMDGRTLEAVEEVCEYRGEAVGGAFGRAVAAVERSRGRTADAAAMEAWRARIRRGLEDMEVERVRRAEGLRRFEWEERRLQEEAEEMQLAVAAAATAAA